MMKRISLSINDKIYIMERKRAMEVMKIAKEKNKGKNVIVGLEKDKVIECRLDEYPNAYALLTAIQEWVKNGYKVHSVKSYR